MSKKLSSRQLRLCAACGKRKNLEWDGRRELCHKCVLKRVDYVIQQHRDNRIPYHEAESEVMERLRVRREEAERRIHPPVDAWIATDAPSRVVIGNQEVKWDEDGNLVMDDGTVVKTEEE